MASTNESIPPQNNNTNNNKRLDVSMFSQKQAEVQAKIR